MSDNLDSVETEFMEDEKQGPSSFGGFLIAYWPILLILALIILSFAGFCIFLFMNPSIAIILRDIAIILLMMTMVIMVFLMILLLLVLVFLAFKISDLTSVLKEGSQTTFSNVDQVLKVVHSRAIITGDELVKPVIRLSSYGAGVKAIFRELFGRE